MEQGIVADRSNVAVAVGSGVLFLIGLAALWPVLLAWAPYSFVTVIPAFLLAGVLGERSLFLGAAIGAMVVPALFVCTARYILSTRAPMPKFSVVSFVLLALLSFAYAGYGWEPTVRYTFASRAVALVLQSVIPPIVIAIAAWALRRGLTPEKSVKLHWVAFAWMAWSAFPWYGELL